MRFVQVFPPVKPSFQPWDSHTNVKTENRAIICAKTDKPVCGAGPGSEEPGSAR